MSEFRFPLGQRVERPIDVYDARSRVRQGAITARYSDYASRFGPYLELYAVTWDDGTVERGFLPHGLQPIPGDAHD